MRSIRLVAALSLLAAGVAGPAAAQGADRSLERLAPGAVLTVAVVPNLPWAVKRQDGRWFGYDIDVVTQLAEDLGVTPRYVETTVADVPRQLATGGADLAVGGLMIQPALARSVVYSAPIGLSVFRTVARGSTTPKFDAQTRLAVIDGSTGHRIAVQTYPRAKIVPMRNAHDAVSAVVHGQADALVAASPVPRLAVTSFGDHLRLVGPPLAKSAEAIALRPGDVRLQSYVNNWIAAKSADGFLQHLRQHWFVGFHWVPDSEGRPAQAATPATR